MGMLVVYYTALMAHLRAPSNGVIDREELRALLEATDGGQQRGDGLHWMSDDEVDRVMRQYSGDAGVLTFDQFARLVRGSS